MLELELELELDDLHELLELLELDFDDELELDDLLELEQLLDELELYSADVRMSILNKSPAAALSIATPLVGLTPLASLTIAPVG